ncbi:MAG: TIGR00341 family protein [Erythrobacter sp.]|uniref:TIGR00341 family protein n=1 Tax=Erythrobacter sp. TaxID=1042 RepID=UPI0026283A8C|nr:TIGR00341 family protein [Erythrobacter sp.]MDJ0979045.1 TIGR00341 family protein [Erythrobacter sp.]
MRSRRTPFSRVVFSLQRYWLQDVIGTVDQAEVIEKRRAECSLSERYLFMTAMSAGIAVLGLLLSSPAVVIGAMLLSPLMDPIMGLGFALAIGDYHWLRQSARSLAWGTIVAIGLTALVVFVSPIKTITPEIVARTEPTLFDLFVALFSALAGAYAMIRGRYGTIVGVAIATALMPPLATVGFGFATWNWTVFSGALLLYVTNLITIALTAWAMARAYGFRTSLTARQSNFQNLAVFAVFIALIIPLTYSLQQIVFQTNAQRIMRAEIEDAFVRDSEIFRLDVDFRADPILVSSTVYTPTLQPNAEAEIERAFNARLSRPAQLSLTQLQVGTSATAAQAAQLSAARANEEQREIARAEDLAKRLALVAGVPESDVTIDRTRRRAMVRAQRLEGASLAAYRALEDRIAQTEPDWTIELLPPMSDLPDRIGFEAREVEEGEEPALVLTDQGRDALDTVAWASARFNVPIVLVGPQQDAERAQELLAQRGVAVSVEEGGAALRAQWRP